MGKRENSEDLDKYYDEYLEDYDRLDREEEEAPKPPPAPPPVREGPAAAPPTRPPATPPPAPPSAERRRQAKPAIQTKWPPATPEEDAFAPTAYAAARVALLISVLFLVLGLIGVYRQSAMMKRYVETEGVVIPGGRLAPVTGGAPDGEACFSPMIEYTYSVNGVDYKGMNCLPGGEALPRKEAIDLLKKYPVGSKLTIHYDSAVPEKSVFVKKKSSRPLVLTVFGAVLTVLFAIILIVTRRASARRET